MDIFLKFLNQENIEYATNEPLSKHTTWKIGGPADVMVKPNNEKELSLTLSFLHKHSIPWLVLGRGSNMLISDDGYRGVIIKLSKSFEHVVFKGEIAVAGGSCSFVKFSLLSAKQGLSGLEFAGGIPGSVGGAVCMNAGAHGGDVSQILSSVRAVKETGEVVVLTNEDLHFRYRNSILSQEKWIVTQATFQLKNGETKEIAHKTSSYKERRMKTQPLKMPSCGSVFKNPLPEHAGALIEKVGLKGYAIGGAEISSMHANFIVNRGGAKAKDVLDLMQLAKDKVFNTYGIQLEHEVQMIGIYDLKV